MDEAELRDDDLHDKRMARLKRERDERAADKTEIERLRAAVVLVRSIIVDGATSGFNPLDGDWAERLFASQAVTYAALNHQPKRGTDENSR